MAPGVKAGGVFICANNATVMLLVSIKRVINLTQLFDLYVYQLIVRYMMLFMYTQQSIYDAYSALQCPMQS